MCKHKNSQKFNTKHKQLEPHLGKIGNIKLLGVGGGGVLKSVLHAPIHLYVAWAWFRICGIGFQLLAR